jgi:phage shock protein A
MASPSSTKNRLADISPATILGKVQDPAPDVSVPELIARFQIETEEKLTAIRREHQAQIVQQDRKIGALEDKWGQLHQEVTTIRGAVEDGLHQMRNGVAEVNIALRQAVGFTERAEKSAAVFDKLKASQPDFHRMVRELDVKLGKVQDSQAQMLEQVNGLRRSLDELEVVAEDYEETKGAVRGIDLVVKNLNAEAGQRRKTGA